MALSDLRLAGEAGAGGWRLGVGERLQRILGGHPDEVSADGCALGRRRGEYPEPHAGGSVARRSVRAETSLPEGLSGDGHCRRRRGLA